jgi:hypothetical protein
VRGEVGGAASSRPRWWRASLLRLHAVHPPGPGNDSFSVGADRSGPTPSWTPTYRASTLMTLADQREICMSEAEIEDRVRPRPIDGKAIASFSLAIVSVLATQFWIIATVTAVAAVSLALASRRSIRADPVLRGTTLSLAGSLLAVGVLVFGTVGPSLLSWFLFTIAPPAASL